jgi:type II secretory pathway component GspD/PulD (secretin)
MLGRVLGPTPQPTLFLVMNRIATSLALSLAFSSLLLASPLQEPQVQMNFTKSHLVEVLRIYQSLVNRRVLVSEELRERPVSINTKEPIPRSEAAKLVESRLANYAILHAAQGFLGLCMAQDAWNELEDIEAKDGARPEVLKVRVEVCRALESWELMAEVSNHLRKIEPDEVQHPLNMAYAMRRFKSEAEAAVRTCTA